ncbi:MAG: S-layer homology domain-containing protein [Candidatus Peribacteraceae bacterium]|nr:S-layer homology domain-containing protein [Candidatus Peribacteraceae bacterium]
MRTLFTSLLTISLLAPHAALAYFPGSLRMPVPAVLEAPMMEPEQEASVLPPMLSAIVPVAYTWNGNQTMTRSTFVAAVVRRLFRPSERCFPKLSGSDYSLLARDVPKDAAYGIDLCTAMRAGLMRGFSDNTFRPDTAVTVAEAAKVLAKAFHLADDPTNPKEPWADPYVEALVRAGALSEHANLKAPITRSEFSAMLWRLRGMQRAQ